MPALPPVILPRFRFRRGALNPPGIAITEDDFLVLRWRGGPVPWESGDPTAPIRFEASARILSPRLTYEDVRLEQVTDTTPRTTVTEVRWPLVVGFLQGVHCGVVRPAASDPQDRFQTGQLHVMLGIGKGDSPTNYVHTLLAQGYISRLSSIGWPAESNVQEHQGLGAVTWIQAADLGAGVETIFALGGYYRLQGLRAVLTTSAAVAARQVRFTARDELARIYYEADSTITQPASTAFSYSLGGNAPKSNTIAARVETPWPDNLWLKPFDTLETLTDNLQAGDVWTLKFGHFELFV